VTQMRVFFASSWKQNWFQWLDIIC